MTSSSQNIPDLKELLGIQENLIVAPMFLVSNEAMMTASHNAGVIGCIPAHNYRTPELLREGLTRLKDQGIRFGINLIVNKSNIYWKEQLKVCLDHEVDFYITSLGNPHEVITEAKKQNKPVLCDVTDQSYSKKVVASGAAGLIAVNSGAGGHLGKIPASILIPMLKQFNLPVIAAGGVATGDAWLSMEVLGAAGVSIGSPFIATEECGVDESYKQACVDYGAKDIVVTDKLSGTPCTVINTPYVQQIGTRQNFVESFLNKNKKVKKWAKALTWLRGMKALEKAAFGATYQEVWCAGSSIEGTQAIEPLEQIIKRLVSEREAARSRYLSK